MSADLLWRTADLLSELAEGDVERTNADPRPEAVWLNSRRYLVHTPAVALAVADWLYEQSTAYAANERIWRVSSLDPANTWADRGLTVERNLEHHHRHALAVARAYLGVSR